MRRFRVRAAAVLVLLIWKALQVACEKDCNDLRIAKIARKLPKNPNSNQRLTTDEHG
jgi:hypothetical protein